METTLGILYETQFLEKTALIPHTHMHLKRSKLEFCYHGTRSFCKPLINPITYYRGDEGFACLNLYSPLLVLCLVPAVGLEYNQKLVLTGLSCRM